MDKGYAILMSIAIVAIFIVCSLLLITPGPTSIDLVSNNSLHNGDSFSIKLTEFGFPVKNQCIAVTFRDANGGPNSMVLKTNDQGIAEIVLGGVTPGNYTVDCQYGGNNLYQNSSLLVHLNVKKGFYY